MHWQTIFGSGILVLFLHSAAWAQESPASLLEMDIEELLKVRVTGSHIRRQDIADFGTVTVIDRETIQHSGATTLEVLLQRLPVSAGYAGNPANAYWSGPNGNGSTHGDLRGLGINRTLVLLNGRRLANGGIGANASVDLNIVPLAVVEKIEILKGGASAIYGADAVAGVVNIITRKNLNGTEAALRYGETFRGDGRDFGADASYGWANERNQLTLGVSHSGNSAASMADRAPCALGQSGDQLVCMNSGNTAGGRALLADGRVVNFNQMPGGDPKSFETYSGSKHNFNSNPFLNAVNPLQRTSGYVFGSLRLNENMAAFTELMYTKRQSDQMASPGTLGLNRTINISATHPTNPTGQDLVLQRRRLLEAGTRNLYQDITASDGVLGLQGKFGLSWDWSLALGFRRNESVDGSTNIANLDRVDQTLDTAVCSSSAGAAIPCGDYLGLGNITPSVLNYIMFASKNRGGNEQHDLTVTVSGRPWQLPAGDLEMAAGIEVRKDRGWRELDHLVEAGIANDNRQDSVSGDEIAREAFTELVVPLLHELSLNSALRFSDYDLFGASTNYKMGLSWQALPTFNLHGSHSTAFRAPNIPELYSGIMRQNLLAADPCNKWNTLSPDSPVYQNCQAAGVPVGYQQPTTTILTTLGGNRNLKPEEAQILSFGAVWEPMSSLRLSADYFSIDIDDAIGTVNGGTKLAACYNAPGLNHPFCSGDQFTRDPDSGDIDFLSVQQMNEASERMAAVDFAMQYRLVVTDWNAKLNWRATRLLQYDLQPYPGAEKTHLAGKITSGRGSYPHWRSLAELALDHGPWSGAYSFQYLGTVEDITAAVGDIGRRVPAITYNNIQGQYAWDKWLDLAVGIDNLYNQPPPYVHGWIDVNTDTMTYDVLGRRWFLKVTSRW